VAGADETTLLRPGEVAAVFGVNAKTVARWARAGLIRSIRTPGGHMRIYAADVRALAARNAEPADTPGG
jgi:excisionase family DNA binding protein